MHNVSTNPFFLTSVLAVHRILLFTTGDHAVDSNKFNTFCAVVESVTFVSLQGIHLQVENTFACR